MSHAVIVGISLGAYIVCGTALVAWVNSLGSDPSPRTFELPAIPVEVTEVRDANGAVWTRDHFGWWCHNGTKRYTGELLQLGPVTEVRP